VEVGDELEESLVREVHEETGFFVQVGRPVHVWVQHATLRSGRSFVGVIISYECQTRSSGPLRLDPAEHTASA
jgi:8-oxo-dGTP pyrophosphatase MutT (NUDIX family)